MTSSSGNGTARVPAWLAGLGIKEGEYFMDSKLRSKRAMRTKQLSPAGRVHVCLGLHTMAFQQELACKLKDGQRVPLTPIDVAAETGLERQNVRRALRELEAAGLVKVEGSTKGQVWMYAYAVPREPKKVENDVFARLPSDQLPQQVISLLRRFKIRLPDNFQITPEYLETVECAARDYKEAEIVLARALKGNPAGERINNDERNEINEEERETTATTSEPVDIRAEPEPVPETAVVVVAPPPPLETVTEALEEHGRVLDTRNVIRMVKECRRWAPHCRDQDIVAAIHEVAANLGPNVHNPMGLILTRVPNCFTKGSYTPRKAQPPPMSESERRRAINNEERAKTCRDLFKKYGDGRIPS